MVWLRRHDSWKVQSLFAERENRGECTKRFVADRQTENLMVCPCYVHITYVRITRENVIRTYVGGSSEAINTGAKPFNAITARRLNVFRTPLNCHAYVCSGYRGRQKKIICAPLIERRFRETALQVPSNFRENHAHLNSGHVSTVIRSHRLFSQNFDVSRRT